LDTVDFVVLCAQNGDRINLSLRSEAAQWPADAITRRILDGIGFGGGHAEMAGGVITDVSKFDKDALYEKMLAALQITQ
jgi:nanoRNase/pAp phosphatase (c-di-AMP/oligoRNAs hydrolase)